VTTVEPADRDDLDAVVDLWVALADEQREHGSHLPPAANREAIRASASHHLLTDGLLIARDDGPVGFVMFGPESGSFEQDVDRGVVRSLYVRPNARGRGIGTDLLTAAEHRLADAGFDVVAIEALADNEGARRLYRRLGYRPHRVELEKSLESDTHTS
jgi:ribosomal protein S18 acetylase RimI-like enzyme